MDRYFNHSIHFTLFECVIREDRTEDSRPRRSSKIHICHGLMSWIPIEMFFYSSNSRDLLVTLIVIPQERTNVESVAYSIGEACHGSEILLVRVFVLRASVILAAILTVDGDEQRHESFVRYRVVRSEPY